MFEPDSALEGKRLYLMRHGKTYEPVLESAMVGPEQDRDLPLTEEGRQQVRDAAGVLGSLKLEAAFSSTFARSVETAHIIAAGHALEVQTRAELEELRLYPKDGGNLRDTARRYIELAKQLERSPADEVELDLGGSVGACVEGALAALRECLGDGGQRVLVVAHGGLNRLLLTQLLGIPLHRFLTFDQDFACVNVIEFVRRGRPWVRAINATVQDPFKVAAIRA